MVGAINRASIINLMLGRVDRGGRWRRPSVRHARALASQHRFSHRRGDLGIRRLSTDADASTASRADSFRALAATFASIESVKGSRDASVKVLAASYRHLLALPTPRTLASALSLTAAQLAPAHRGVELRFGTKSFAQLLKQLEPQTIGDKRDQITERELAQVLPSIEQMLTRSPDYGSAVQELLAHDRIALTPSELSATSSEDFNSMEQLTIEQVHDELLQIAGVEGTGGVGRKQQRALGLLQRCRSPSELVFLVRILAVSILFCVRRGSGNGGRLTSTRLLHGSEEQHQNLRIGMGDKSILTALALATLPIDAGTSVSDEGATAPVTVSGTKDWIECVTRAYAQLPDFAALADKLHANRSEIRLAEKLKWLPEHVPPTAGVPVLTMSAYPVGSVAEVLRRTSKSGSSAAAFEYKYDGARVQLHFTSNDGNDWEHARQVGDGARVFSRNMEDTTEKYGSLLGVLARQVKGSGPVSFIMEGEVVALDRATNTFHPFQVLQAKATTEFCLFAFDLLAINGESLLDQPLRKRRARLRDLIIEAPGYVELVKSIDIDLDTSDEEGCSESSPVETVVRDFLERAVTSGCEGLMVKTLDGDSSSYRAGMRSYSWMKLKQDYLSESPTESVGSAKPLGNVASRNRDTGAFLPDTLDLVPIGAFYGKGRRTGGFGSFLLATYNSTSGKFETIGKVGSGFSDAAVADASMRLEPMATADKSVPELFVSNTIPSRLPDVWLTPTEVWEIKATQLTMSSSYTCGTELLEASTSPDQQDDATGKRCKGLALRFPRFLRRRPDKSPRDATDSEQVVELFRQAAATPQTPSNSS